MAPKFNTVLVGGTFDKLHKGHRALLIKAFKVGKNVVIGLSSDALASKLSKNHPVEPYEQRLKELEEFLIKDGLEKRAKIVPLDNVYGITLSTTDAQAIIVSRETELRTFAINEKRKISGLTPLEVVAIEMVPADDKFPISTTRIRYEEIDREGRLLEP